MASLQVTSMLVSSSKYGTKCPYEMSPTYITRHDTYNDASAMSEVSYMIGNSRQVSFHVAVDDYRAVQGIPYSRNAWHCGDGGSGTGNRHSIGVEVCYSKSGGDRYTKACDNALTMIAMLMKQYGIPATRVYYHRHWSGKNCPHRLISQGVTEAQYQQMVQARYNEMYGGGAVVVNPAPVTGKSHSVGEVVNINGVYKSSGSDTKLKPAKTKGTITKIVSGARNPYLLDNGNIGWVNDGCIIGTIGSTNSTATSSGSKSIDTVAQEVINGKWGSGDVRKQKLQAAGYNYSEVQARVNQLLGVKSSSSSSTASSKKSVATIAQEVMNGKWGSGDDRKKRLQAAGYDYSAVQAEVNRLCGKSSSSSSSSKKSVQTIAKEVLAGKWGNGTTRKQKLQAAGYNYSEVQAAVNKLAK